MSDAGRNDSLTLVILYWNSRKEKILTRLITSRLLIAVHRVHFYQKRLVYLLGKRGLTEADLPHVHLQLNNKAFEYIKSNRGDKKKTKLEIVQNEIETLYYEHSNMHDRIASVLETVLCLFILLKLFED
ncbi:uncharacterized protein LOC116935542 [Daphnia magna]|uniref:uncharacterized protein LOC116935542 n=1 Tax=Daphnia magna TaxID=35525 RepID=UPI001E1BABAA|nr:uncharacterized protein LOC116935542 [Daphnia magna]